MDSGLAFAALRRPGMTALRWDTSALCPPYGANVGSTPQRVSGASNGAPLFAGTARAVIRVFATRS